MIALLKFGPNFGCIRNPLNARENTAEDGSNEMGASNIIFFCPQFGIVDSFLTFYGIIWDTKVHLFILIGETLLDSLRAEGRNNWGV